MTTTTANMEIAQARYKQNFDSRIRRQRDDIVEGDQAFLSRDELLKPEERSYKLLPVVNGPFPVTKVTARTVFLLIGYNLEEVSRDRVTRAHLPTHIKDEYKPTPSPARTVNPLDDLSALFWGRPKPVKGILTRQDVKHTLNNSSQTPHYNITQEDVQEMMTGETQTPPLPPTEPYTIMDRIVDHGNPCDGMLELEEGTPVWRVRW